MIETDQMNTWRGDFGKSYTDRNPKTVEDVEALALHNYGVSQTSLNERFLSDIPKSANILEVGCNVGSQLAVLAEMGYHNLYGIELQRYAVEIAKHNLPGVDVIEGSAFDIPFKDNFFDLVFTSGVLIHISPEDLHLVIAEIVRCSRSFIWGFEYFSAEEEVIPYRGHDALAWKTNFSQVFLKLASELVLIQEEEIPYLSSPNVDVMYLLKKG